MAGGIQHPIKIGDHGYSTQRGENPVMPRSYNTVVPGAKKYSANPTNTMGMTF